MSFEINWYRNFFNISWAREQDKLVLLVVFEDKKVATNVAKEIESWSEKFTRLTIIEKEQDEFAICCYEDPQISKSDKRIGLFLTYPMATGRNFNEILRAIDSMQLTVTHKVATPANWNKGEDVIIVPAVKDDEAKKLYPNGWKALKPYLRKVPDPSK